MRRTILALALCASAAQRTQDYTIANDKLALAIEAQGGAFHRLHLLGDEKKQTPLSSTHGHFLCADAFGPSSPEERAAGLSSHGEANKQLWKLDAKSREGNVTTLQTSATLPIAGERFTRKLRLVDGEQVIYVANALENLTAMDKPVVWQEHATVGAPFLTPGRSVIDVSAVRAMTRPPREGMPDRFKPGEEFTWPNAPASDGSTMDLRQTPRTVTNSITTQLMPKTGLAYATALNLEQRLMIGWVFRGADFPWLQNWESYSADGQLYRGLEFGFTAFGRPRREVVTAGILMDTPLYRWLPAKGRIEAGFLIFLTRVPQNMQSVDSVSIDKGVLLISDRKTGAEVSLAASLPW